MSGLDWTFVAALYEHGLVAVSTKIEMGAGVIFLWKDSQVLVVTCLWFLSLTQEYRVFDAT
jgi:hypothetical protein